MNTAAMTRLAVTTRRARRDRAMTAGMVVRSSRTITASAVWSVRSEPLLDEAVYHSEHLRLGLADRPDVVG
jgi:hypothetical protein